MFTKSGRAYTPAKTEIAERRIAWGLKQSIPQELRREFPLGSDIAVVINLFFFVTKPKRPKHEFPSKSDLDNYTKLFLDAANGILFKDDRQIIEFRAGKGWAKSAGHISYHLTWARKQLESENDK